MRDINYESDFRVIGAQKAAARKFNPQTMTLVVQYQGLEGDVEEARAERSMGA